MDKKKRHTSGSRSKSRKSKPNEFSVELKPSKMAQPLSSHEQSKMKTENSLNKSKGSRKHSKHVKKPKLLKGSKDVSRSLSAERKHSLTKMNRTEANFEQDDVEKRIYNLKKSLHKIPRPTETSTRQITNFYKQIQQSIDTISEPLYSLLCYLHDLYLQPISQLLSMIAPYEELLRKKKNYARQIEQVSQQNDRMAKNMSVDEVRIIRLKEKIQEQRQCIQLKQREVQNSKKQQAEAMLDKQRKLQKGQPISNGIFSNEGVVRKMNKEKQRFHTIENNSSVQFSQIHNDQPIARQPSPEIQEVVRKEHSMGMKGLKLDFGGMNKGETMGFHDEFYSNIDQFSESWRQQALREKRF